MSAEQLRDPAQPDDRLSDEKIALYRSYLSTSVLSEGLCALFPNSASFEKLSWSYFLADVELEARAARIKVPCNWSAESISDTIKVLPPIGVLRVMAARFVYFSPLAPENETQVDWLLQPLDAATVKLMRQRRHAIHAAQAIELKQEEASKHAAAQEETLRAEWYACARATLSTEPEDFLRWIKVQTPDTWHVIVQGWDHNCDDQDDVIEWILDQPNCDLGTVAKFFFTAGLADQDPEKLSPCYRRKWLQMKRAAENWQRGHYARNELDPWVEPSDMQSYDDVVARLEAEGRPLPWKVPPPQARQFGARQPDSAYHYEHGYLKLKFDVWERHRERSGCGKDFPRCCQA